MDLICSLQILNRRGRARGKKRGKSLIKTITLVVFLLRQLSLYSCLFYKTTI